MERQVSLRGRIYSLAPEDMSRFHPVEARQI
jgi:hypothetical protein